MGIKNVTRYIAGLITSPYIQLLIAILSLGFILRLAYVALIPTLPVSDFAAYSDLAVNLLLHGIYGSGTVPGSFRPPGESFFLYIVYALSGSTDPVYPKVVQVVMGTLNIAFVYQIAKKAFGPKAAIIASLLMAIFPTQIFYTSILASENTFTFLNLLALAAFASAERASKGYYPLLFAAGISLGCGVLVRPVSTLLPALMLAAIVLRDYRGASGDRKELTKLAVAASIFIVAVAVIVAPWCLRNYEDFGNFGVSSNGGLAFWIGNNENATGTYYGDVESAMTEKFRDTPELNDFQKEDVYYADAIQYILSHPVDTIKLDLKKIGILYGSSTLGIYWSMVADSTIIDPGLRNNLDRWIPVMSTISNGYYFLILALAIIGLPVLVPEIARKRNYRALTLIAYILYFSIIYSISLVDDRYNFNILPILAILAAYTISKALWHDKPLETNTITHPVAEAARR